MKIKMLATVSLALFSLTRPGLSEEGKQQATATTNTAPPSASVKAAKPDKDDQYHVIGYLEKRDRVITIKSGPKGTVYSVATKDGKTLFENVSSEQLKAQAPELHDLIKTGVAGDARVRPSKIDAGFR
jgi:hypothetical protein